MADYSYRKKNRLINYDYSQNGAYFITICAENRKKIFSEIVGGGVLDTPQTRLNQCGAVIVRRIEEMNRIYRHIKTTKYVVMPNHIHLLVHIDREEICGAAGTSRTPSPTSALIPQYVSTLKRMCNKEIGRNIWQRSYHDRIIRDDAEYDKIWQYIDTNPLRWELDCFYTEE